MLSDRQFAALVAAIYWLLFFLTLPSGSIYAAALAIGTGATYFAMLKLAALARFIDGMTVFEAQIYLKTGVDLRG